MCESAPRSRAEPLPPACAPSDRGRNRLPRSHFPSKLATPTSTGTRLPSLRKYSFSYGLHASRSPSARPSLAGRSSHSGGVRSVQRTRPETRSSRSYPNISEKRVIGLDDPASALPDHDPDDVGVDQASDPGFPFLEIAVQTGILQRDRRLRCEQLPAPRSGRA